MAVHVPRPVSRFQHGEHDFDAEVARLVAAYPADLGVLAGYMLIFTPSYVETHPLVNLHPALPGGPVGTYVEVIRALIRAEASESGVMLNVAIPEVDMGPVAAFCRYPITGPDFDPAWASIRQEGEVGTLADDRLDASLLFERIRAAQVRHEAPFLVSALQAFAEGWVWLEGRRVTTSSGTGPLDLTAAVAAQVRAGGVV